MSRPRVVWLLDDRSPTGTAVMTLRRASVLAGRADQSVLALRPGPTPPAGAPLRAVGSAAGVAGEIAIAGADVVVTTSELTLASAVARRTGRGSLVHAVHEPALIALGRARVARSLPAVDWLLVPEGTDLDRVAALVPLPRDRIVATADFVLPTDSLLSSARGHVLLAAGRLGPDDTILDVVDGFAAAGLPSWELRVAGDGPGLDALRDHVEAHRLADRVLVLGACHDLAAAYLDAGAVVRLAPSEAGGLSVLEALAAGLPVISSPASPAAARHVRDGENGLLLERLDAVSIAEAVTAIADDSRRAGFAAAARSGAAGLLDDEARRRFLTDAGRVLVDHPSKRSGRNRRKGWA